MNTPADNSVTAGKTDISIVAGDVIYGNGTDSWTRLAKGTAGQVLKMNSGATAPEWAADNDTNTQVGGSTAVDFNDNVKARWGTGNDLEIYHDASNSYIADTGTGGLFIRGDSQILLQSPDGEQYIIATKDGSVDLYYNNVKEFETKSGGVKLNGHSEQAVNALGNTTGSTTIDFSVANIITATLTGATTFANPTTESVGQSGSIIVTQDGTGGRTLAWGTQFKWTGGTAPTLSTAASAVDRIDYLVVAADTIHCVASLDVK